MKSTFVLGIVGILTSEASANVQTYVNDPSGFFAAAGAVNMIDFETLPNGQPTIAGVAITQTFNYDAEGAHFSVPLGTLMTGGNNMTGHDIRSHARISVTRFYLKTFYWPTS